MRAILVILLSATATVAHAGDQHLTRAAEMMVDKTYCDVSYDTDDLRNEFIKAGVDEGVSVTEAANRAAALAVQLSVKIDGSVGKANYCLTRG